jgi:hypothetical protein
MIESGFSQAGLQDLAPGNLTAMGFVHGIYMMDLRSFLMPSVVHGFKISSEARMGARTIALAMLLAVLVSVIVSFFTYLEISYEIGGNRLQRWFYVQWPETNFNDLQRKIDRPSDTIDVVRLAWMGVGGAVMSAMMLIRQRLFWFPHPIGYVAMMSLHPMLKLWFSIFLGWLLKSGIIKYGGFRLYYRMRAFFIGIVVGEVVAGGFWILMDYLFNIHTGWPIHIN